MRCCPRVLVPTILAAACWSGDATPPLDVEVADGARLVEHWNASVYATVWNDPAFADARQKFADSCADAAKTIGFDPRDVLPAMKAARVQLTGMDKGDDGKPRAQVTASVELGELAAKIMKLAAAKAKPATVAGADEALAPEPGADGQRAVLARFGGTLVAALNGDAAKPAAFAEPAADLQARVVVRPLLEMLARSMPEEQADLFKATLANEQVAGASYDYTATLVPEGILERFLQDRAWPHLIAVDRQVLGRLPGTTLLAIGVGTDGKQLWKTGRPSWMAQAAAAMGKERGQPMTADEAEQAINDQLANVGLHCTVQDLVEGFDGTSLAAIGQGVPFPTVTLAVPRSAALDGVVAFAMQQFQAEAPAEGTSTMLPIPNLPVAVNVICDKKHWVLTSDPTVTANWPTGAAGGWADSPAGKQALAKAPQNAFAIGASDTPGVLRTIGGYLNMVLGMQQGMDAQQKQAALQAVTKLSATASAGYVFADAADGKTTLESRGLMGFIGLPIAGGVIGFLSAREVQGAAASGEAAAVADLKTGIFPAEVQFQAGAYVDQDGNGVGEYGLLGELGGARAVTGAPKLQLVSEELAGGSAHGWRYAVYIPDADGAALAEPADAAAARAKDAKAAPAQEKHFVAYAWPDDGTSAKHMFAITQDGQLLQAPFFGDAPAWGDAFGGQGWDAKPQWEPYKKP